MPGLATRCTACGTVFRVVPDQLRVSDGWVRCGRCAEVFNAAEHLLDMDSGEPRRLPSGPVPEREAAPAWEASAGEGLYDPARDVEAGPDRAAGEAASAAEPVHMYGAGGAAQNGPHSMAAQAADRAPAASGGWPTDAPGHAATPSNDDPFDDEPGHSGHSGHSGDPDAAPQREARPTAPIDDPADAGFHVSDHVVDGTPADPVDRLQPPDLPDLHATPRDFGALRPADTAVGDATPSFLRRAERGQRWRRPRVRAALWGVVLLGAVGLAAQVVHTYRDLAAARVPALRPALEQACGWLQCSVGEARAIDSLLVESSGLVRVEKSNIYKLSLAVRNRAAIAVAVPDVEIALTDGQGKLLARRVLRAAELGASQAAVAAGRDLALQATLQAAVEPVAGYTIELFYP